MASPGNTDDNRPLEIALIGAGITSLHLAHGLLTRCPHLSLTVYEAAPALRGESGAAVGIGKNGQNALKLLGPKLYESLLNAGAVRMEPHVRFMIGTGPRAGVKVKDIEVDVPQLVVGRSAWLEKVQELLPPDVVKAGKKVVGVDAASPHSARRMNLQFEDGTTETADAIIGADGINSSIRSHILPPVIARPFYTTGHNHRALIPMALAREAFGEEYCATHTQHGWIGDHGFILTDILSGGEEMQVVTGGISSDEAPWPHDAPVIPWTMKQLEQALEPWGAIGNSVAKVFAQQPRLFAAGGRLHSPTPTFVKGRMCVAGDAAQTFGPFLGAGASQGLEDALMLTTLLTHCFSAHDIEVAFEVYDALRVPRRQEVARLSEQSAKILTGLSRAGVDAESLRRELEGWGRSVWDHELATAQRDAVESLKRRK